MDAKFMPSSLQEWFRKITIYIDSLPTFAATGTSGGIPFFDSATTIASSAVLTANQLVLGGGAATTPATLGSLGTTATVLHGNAAGAPTFGAVALASDVSGTLPVGNGGTGATSLADGGLVIGNATGAVEVVAAGATTQILVGGGALTAPVWGTDLPTAVTVGTAYIYRIGGTDVSVADGGTSLSTLTAHAVYVGNGASAPTALAVGATNTFLKGSTGADPAFGTATLASADFANQGTTTTVLHGNAAGNPSFAAVNHSTEMTSLQGGTTNEYYHLTSAQHTDLTDAGDSSLHYHATDRDLANATGQLSLSNLSDLMAFAAAQG